MFDQVRALVEARMGEIGGKEEAPDYYAQNLNQSIWEMNEAWYNLQNAQETGDGEAEASCLRNLGEGVAKVVCVSARV